MARRAWRHPARPSGTIGRGWDAGEVYRGLVDTVGAGFVLLEIVPGTSVEREGLGVIDVNELACRACGHSREELLGRPVEELSPPVTAAASARFFAVARAGMTDVFQERDQQSGITHQFRVYCPLPGLVAILWKDVTAEVATKQALEESAHELRECQRVARVGTWSRDLVTGLGTWSDEAFRMHGLSPGTGVPQPETAHQFYEPDSLKAVIDSYAELRRAGTPYEIEVRLRPAPGRAKALIARGEAVRDGDGRVVRIRGTVVDISERVAAQEAEERVARQLAQAARAAALLEMGASLAHDLSQPLAAIQANAQAVLRARGREGKPPGELDDILGDIVAAARRTTEVMGRLLRSGSSAPAAVVPVDLSEVVWSAVPLLRSLIRARDGELVLELPGGLPMAAADPFQVQQLVVNLATNAVEAVAGLAERRVAIRTRAGDGTVVLEVEDSGPGIPDGHEERVFEPFFTTNPDGIGLGLAACRRIVQAHSGTVRAGCAAGGGACFVVELPVSRPEAEP